MDDSFFFEKFVQSNDPRQNLQKKLKGTLKPSSARGSDRVPSAKVKRTSSRKSSKRDLNPYYSATANQFDKLFERAMDASEVPSEKAPRQRQERRPPSMNQLAIESEKSIEDKSA